MEPIRMTFAGAVTPTDSSTDGNGTSSPTTSGFPFGCTFGVSFVDMSGKYGFLSVQLPVREHQFLHR